MDQTAQPLKDYEIAKCEVCSHAWLAVFDLAASMDFHQNLAEGSNDLPNTLLQYIQAYGERLSNVFHEETLESDDRSLAVLQHKIFLLDRFVDAFERMVPSVEEAEDDYGRSSIARTKEEIIEHRQKIETFMRQYEAEIVLEEESACYKRDTKLVERCVEDLFRASHGQWTPELVSVKSYMGTGESRAIETPGSNAMNRIATAVREGRLRLPPALLSLEC